MSRRLPSRGRRPGCQSVPARLSAMSEPIVEDPIEIAPDVFRRVMGHFVTGVTVVTTLSDSGPQGITVNALSSISLEPPLVMVALDRRRFITPAVRLSGRYAVNVLSEDQRALSDCFAGAPVEPGRDAFCGASWTKGSTGLPLIDGAIATLECTVVQTFEAGDHELFIGRVDAMANAEPHPMPLLYYRRQYLRIQRAETSPLEGVPEHSEP
jgi:3-hydroxy-9,10-secoandrosta-1,3,5(10)-triene-9,17-dione monooxygenase reductase component